MPETISGEPHLDDLLSEPTEAAVRAIGEVQGDILLLGVGGKMGPTLARMAKRAAEAVGDDRRVIGVSRFSNPEAERELQTHGVETIRGDLLDESFLDSLPDAPNIIHMAAMKFGATGNASLTWAMNVHLPARVCRRFRDSRIVAFSTGNVYGLTPAGTPGSRETDPLDPVGEYAMTALGRERMFEHFSHVYDIPVSLVRLNYAVEMRYGVLVDLARQVHDEMEIDLSMGYANVIWQGDANAMTLCTLPDAASPPFVINVAGPERLSVRKVCEQLAELMGKPVHFTGTESPSALLSNGEKGRERYGPPRVDAAQMIHWIADWTTRGGPTLGKPTRFEVRDGRF